MHTKKTAAALTAAVLCLSAAAAPEPFIRQTPASAANISDIPQEYRTACDEKLGTGVSSLLDGLYIYTAVYGEDSFGTVLIKTLSVICYPCSGFGDIRLSAEAGTNRHDEYKINSPLLEERIDGLSRRIRMDRDACLLTEVTYSLNKLKGLICALYVECDVIGTCFCERLNELFGIRDHEMSIENKITVLADRLNYGHADSKIRNVVPVHDIEMQELAVRCDALYIPHNIAEISRQKRW